MRGCDDESPPGITRRSRAPKNIKLSVLIVSRKPHSCPLCRIVLLRVPPFFFLFFFFHARSLKSRLAGTREKREVARRENIVERQKRSPLFRESSFFSLPFCLSPLSFTAKVFSRKLKAPSRLFIISE